MTLTDTPAPAPEFESTPIEPGSSTDPNALPVGAAVEVRTRLDARRWARGFEVAAVEGDGYRLRRSSDGQLLPVAFPAEDVRAERKRGTWWY